MTPHELHSAVQALLDPGHEATSLIYPRNAAALNRDPEGLMVSAAVVLSCDGCGQDVAFNGCRIEGYFEADGTLRIESTWSRQHGCGTWAPPVVWVAASFDEPVDPEALVAQLRALLAEARSDRNKETVRRLHRELTEFLAFPADEREATGSEVEPGIYHEDGRWVAWAYDARRPTDGPWDTITVTEQDLTERAES